jgi:hypothetical protein
MVNSFNNDSQVPPAATPARLIESGMELVRAEVAVALARARQAILRALTALLATIVAAALLQVALVVVILSPLLVRTLPSESVWMAVALPALLALASLVAAALAWSGTRRSLRQSATSDAIPFSGVPSNGVPSNGVPSTESRPSAPRLAPVRQGRVAQ